jgi:hypothetical protein
LKIYAVVEVDTNDADKALDTVRKRLADCGPVWVGTIPFEPVTKTGATIGTIHSQRRLRTVE